MTPYFYVYRVGDRGPTIKHPTLEAAKKEAERLSARHPGATFEILQCLGVTKTVEPQTFWMDGMIPPHTCEIYRLKNNTCAVCNKQLR